MAERYDFYVHDNRKITFNLTEPIMREDSGVTDFLFHIPKILNELEVSDWQWWLVFVNAKKEKYSIALTLSDDPERPLEYNLATYTVDYAMSIKAGSVQFALEAINAGTGGAIDNEWHTQSYEIKVKETLQGNQAEYAETESDIISELLIEVRNKVNQLVGGATPEPKSLIADMTDTKKVYLYVGLETGESTNYWYYYNGSAWVPGGVYGAGVVDSAPTQGSTNAVSSGGVWDEIADLKSELTAVETVNIPCAFAPMTDKADLTLADYSGKKVFISNKNLLPQFPQYTNNGITFTPNDDGSLTLSGTASAVATVQLTRNTIPNLGAGTYTLSCGNAEAIGDNNTYLNVAIDEHYVAIYARLNSVDGKITFTVPEGSRVTAIRIRIPSGVTIPQNFKIYPQCEEGTEKTEFVKHYGTVIEPTSASVEGVTVYPDYTYICAQSGVTGYVTYDKSVIDELDSRVTTLEQKSRKFVGKKIVCFGDSITGNYQPPDDYPSMIADITGATVYNAGFGGCCMSDNDQIRKLFTMCRLADAIVGGTGNYGDFTAQRNSGVSITYGGTSIDYVPIRLTMLESIDWTTIDYITIAYGTNDWNSNYGLDNNQNLLDTTTYIGAFRYAVETILTKFPNIKILVITPLWRWWDTNTGMPSEIHSDYIDSNDYAKGTGYKLWQYGDALVEASKLYHIPVFDLYWNCMMFKQNRFQYFNTTDGTHPKLEGMELMAELISAHMESVY